MKVNLIGLKFGRLTVVNKLYIRNQKQYWECLCDCGNKTEVPTGHLKSGHTTSCGCYHSEISKKVNTTHGGKHERLYSIWFGMKKRCFNPKEPAYKYYGERGIKVCDEWAENYSLFREWALKNGYDDTLSIERKDVNGNYCPENCCWIPLNKQNSNKRNNVLITYNGKTQILKRWAEEVGVSSTTITNRLKKGMELKNALNFSNTVETKVAE